MRKGPITTLKRALREDVAAFDISVDGARVSLKDYVRNSPTDAVIIVYEGRVVFEDYPRMQTHERHLWWSVSKIFVSTAVAILEDHGKVDVNQSIDSYLEHLKGTAWGGIPVIDILDMASGIDCPEKHDDPEARFWDFYDALGWPEVDKVSKHPKDVLKTMPALRPPGQVQDYTSVNTEVLKWLVEARSGERYAKFVEREIWQRLGAEHDAVILGTPNGDSVSAAGICSTLRDLARFGMLFTPMGRAEDTSVISNAYLQKIQKGGRPKLIEGVDWYRRLSNIAEDVSVTHSTYQWDIVTSIGSFYKEGFGGQGLYVSPGQDLVIAWFGTPNKDGKQNKMLEVALQLSRARIFDQ